MKYSQTLLSLAALAPSAMAWGDMGHETVAYVATDFLSPETLSFCQKIIGVDTADALAGVATWADSYRYTSAGSYSEPYHFIDALDSPPHSCSVDFERDCSNGKCVVAAITNYTSQVQKGVGESGKASTELFDALKFVIHFLGDIHQPLHDENEEVGGNDIDVTYGSKQTNLHASWDTSMPEDYTGGGSLSDARTWATKLTTDIKTGTYASEAASWLDGMNLDEAQTSAMAWASEANAYVCTTVCPNGMSALSGQDLSGDYYNSVLPTIQIQIARAGYRLAAWLNLIVTGSTGASGSGSSSGSPVHHSTTTSKHTVHHKTTTTKHHKHKATHTPKA